MLLRSPLLQPTQKRFARGKQSELAVRCRHLLLTTNDRVVTLHGSRHLLVLSSDSSSASTQLPSACGIICHHCRLRMDRLKRRALRSIVGRSRCKSPTRLGFSLPSKCQFDVFCSAVAALTPAASGSIIWLQDLGRRESSTKGHALEFATERSAAPLEQR